MLVLDASTLILLAKTELLALLVSKTSLQIPQEVQREVLAKPDLYDARLIATLVEAGKIHVIAGAVDVQRRKRIQDEFGLEPGEAAALLLAKETRSPVATDDGVAMKAAKLMGIPCVTAIHVLRELYAHGRLDQDSALAKLERLATIGRYSVAILEHTRAGIQQP